MTDEEKAHARDVAEHLIKRQYYAFMVKHKKQPQLIRVSKDLWDIMVPKDCKTKVTWNTVPLIMDEDLKSEECVCQWKN